MALFNNPSGLLSGLLTSKQTGSTTAAAAVSKPVNAQPVKGRFLTTQSATLGAAQVAAPTFQIPNFNGLPMSSLKFAINTSITDTTTTATVLPVESVIAQLQLTDNVGNIIMQLDGRKNDISLSARLFSNNGQYTPSPYLTGTTSNSATPGTYTASWNIEYPYSIPASAFPLNLNVIFSGFGDLATAGAAGLTAGSASISIYGDYVNHSFTYAKLRSIDIPIAGTGTITLNTFYDQLQTYLLQAYQYGSDSVIGPNGITFSTDGSLQQLNVPLESYIDEENLNYPNSVSPGVGHINGFINLFSPAFKETAATQLQINFASVPSLLNPNYSGKIRSYWVEAL
ncbi:MAG: hypothetical protein QXW39_06190 [Candidatus Bathyarchaeia archaeon]